MINSNELIFVDFVVLGFRAGLVFVSTATITCFFDKDFINTINNNPNN